jgi:hypothetical protein
VLKALHGLQTQNTHTKNPKSRILTTSGCCVRWCPGGNSQEERTFKSKNGTQIKFLTVYLFICGLSFTELDVNACEFWFVSQPDFIRKYTFRCEHQVYSVTAVATFQKFSPVR